MSTCEAKALQALSEKLGGPGYRDSLMGTPRPVRHAVVVWSLWVPGCTNLGAFSSGLPVFGASLLYGFKQNPVRKGNPTNEEPGGGWGKCPWVPGCTCEAHVAGRGEGLYGEPLGDGMW